MARKLRPSDRKPKPVKKGLPHEAADLLFQKGLRLHQKGEWAKAQAVYEHLLAQQPQHFDALHGLGLLAARSQNHALAQALIGKAIEINPDSAFAHYNRAQALQELHQLEEAIACYDAVSALQPDVAQAFYNRGLALQELQQPEEAVASYDSAIALQPDYALAFYNRGMALQALEQFDAALASYDKAIDFQNNDYQAHNNRGVVLQKLKRSDEALASYVKAITLKPDYAEAFHNMGITLQLHKKPDEALACFDTALTLKPDYEFLLGTKLHAQMLLCDWRGLSAELIRLETALDQGLKVTAPFAILGLTDKPALQLKASRVYAAATVKAPDIAGDFKRRDASERIRIGYFSADFQNHATAYLMAELFEAHDAQRFELYGFSFGPPKQDAMRQRLSNGFDHFFDVTQKSDPEVALMSRALGIDIAVDLKGYTQDARTGIFAQRCAPVQVNYLGYPGTMGAPFFDYIVADKVLIPPESQQHYSEKVVYLPHSYQVNDAKRKISDTLFTRQALGLPESGFVFCCFNNNYKILPTTFDAWMRLLKAVDGSVLWLFENNATAAHNLRQEAQARGVEPSRLVFAKHVQLEDHLARHRAADLFLDTLPCNAHTTTSDALWAGLPVLTLMGQTFAARVAASLLTAMDLPELITHTQEDYEARALELAQNPLQLARLKDKLERNRATSTLFNGQLFARHLEAAYVQMHKRHLSGERPELIEVQALVV
jgi:predicted O-linked N-acetylglucosamine transferase (SPINDLY family)